MKQVNLSIGLLLAGAALAGCHSGGGSSTPPAATMPTSMPAAAAEAMPPKASNASPTAVATPATVAPVTIPKEFTHEVTTDQSYFATMSDEGKSAAGTLKKGSKVLVLIPGMPYSQVITDTGMTGYTMTSGLKPLGK